MFDVEQVQGGKERLSRIEGEIDVSHQHLPLAILESNNGEIFHYDSAGAIVSRKWSSGSEESAEKIRKTLAFRNPGPQLSDFNPDTSRREMRKIKRFVQKQQASKRRRRKPQKQTFHDRSGIRISDGKDVCDCQDMNCPGCHFPCSSCGSERCGVECRCDRKWTYLGDVDVENPMSSARRITRR